jgi:nucleotide-binding universal stress UspA family protein
MTPICRIVVPLDGTSAAELALDTARIFARVAHAPITLVRGYSATSYLPSGNAPMMGEWPLVTTSEVHEYLESVERGLRNEGFAAESYIAEWPGEVAIVRAAQECGASLIVIASNLGAGGPHLPSPARVALEVLHHAECGVLVIPIGESGPLDHAEERGIRLCLVVPPDMTQPDMRVLAIMADLLRLFGGAVRVMMLTSMESEEPDAGTASAVDAHLPAWLATGLSDAGIAPETVLASTAGSLRTCAACAHEQADLMCIGVRKDERHRMETVAAIARMLRSTRQPLLFVP